MPALSCNLFYDYRMVWSHVTYLLMTGATKTSSCSCQSSTAMSCMIIACALSDDILLLFALFPMFRKGSGESFSCLYRVSLAEALYYSFCMTTPKRLRSSGLCTDHHRSRGIPSRFRRNMSVYLPTGSSGIPRLPSRRQSLHLPSKHLAIRQIRAWNNRSCLAKLHCTFLLDRFLPTTWKIVSPSTDRRKTETSCRWQQCTRHSWLRACCTETTETWCSKLDRTSCSTWLVYSSDDILLG
jgi:hypothetical protein